MKIVLSVVALSTAPFIVQAGYRDTPHLPGSRWRVHDTDRPLPPVVTPPTTEPGAGAPPGDATVLFDGTDLDAWRAGDEAAQWTLTDEGELIVNGTGSIQTVAAFGDVQLHLEWRSPTEIESSGQGRGNSGVFLMGRYEIQILDSFENPTYADGQAGALYGQHPPLVDATLPPGAWQSFDIVFRAPRFDGDELVSPARATVFHNGVCIHDAAEFFGSTAHRAVATYAPHPPTGPLVLQDHGNPVAFRNIWIRPLAPRD